MWIIVNGRDLSSYIAPASVSLDQGQGDQETNFEFVVDDAGSQLSLNSHDEVIALDERGALTQTQNLLIDPVFANNATYYGLSGNLSGLLIFNGSPTVTATPNNSAVGNGTASQATQTYLVVPDQTYVASIYLRTTVALTNASAFLTLTFLDAAQNAISNGTFTVTASNVPVKTRFNVSGVAPTGTAFALLSFGITTTNATNSGSVQFSAPQLEAAMFAAQGQIYPTPDCNVSQIGCVVLPNGTCVRQNRVFAGRINLQTRTYDGPNRRIHVQCAHLSEMLELRLINLTFANGYDSQIIANVLSNYYAGFLTGNGVIQGKFFDSISFDDSTFKELLNTLGDSSGYTYFVSNYGDVTYAPPSTINSSISFKDVANPDYVTVFPLIDYQFVEDYTQKGSRIKARGGKYIAPAITDTFSGNGSTTQFTLTQQPYNVQSVTIGGVSQKTGINGVNTLGSGGYVAVIDKANQYIKFQTAPASGTNNIAVTYTYESNVYLSESDINVIGKYGLPFDRKFQDTALLSIAALSIRAIQELIQYANPRRAIKAKANVYVQPGYNVLVTSTRDNIFAQSFTVQKVKTVPLGNDLYEYEYELGSYRPDFIDRVKNAQKSLARSKTTANQPLQSQNIYASEIIFYGGDRITVTATTAFSAKYGTSRYGFASYGTWSPSGSPNPSTYGSGTYGVTTWT